MSETLNSVASLLDGFRHGFHLSNCNFFVGSHSWLFWHSIHLNSLHTDTWKVRTLENVEFQRNGRLVRNSELQLHRNSRLEFIAISGSDSRIQTVCFSTKHAVSSYNSGGKKRYGRFVLACFRRLVVAQSSNCSVRLQSTELRIKFD